MARTGKLARLPLAIREQVNHRILDGEKFRSIIKWLNEQPEVRAVLEREFHGDRINDQNFSDWHQGGYRDWLGRREQIDRTRELAGWSMKLAEASGGNLAEGAASILAGRILEVLEGLDGMLQNAEGKPGTKGTAGTEGPDADRQRLTLVAEAIDQLTLAVTRLRKGDHSAESLRLDRERLAQDAQSLELDRQKFQRTTCELFLTWAADQRAKDIAAAPGASNSQKIEAIGKLMFGEDWS